MDSLKIILDNLRRKFSSFEIQEVTQISFSFLGRCWCNVEGPTVNLYVALAGSSFFRGLSSTGFAMLFRFRLRGLAGLTTAVVKRGRTDTEYHPHPQRNTGSRECPL